MKHLIIALLAALLCGCVEYSAEKSTPDIEIQVYPVVGLDALQLSHSLNNLSSEVMPIKASVAVDAHVLVAAPAHVHQRLPAILEELGAHRGERPRQIGVSVWHLQAIPADTFALGDAVPQQVGESILEMLRLRGMDPHRVSLLDEAFVSTTVSRTGHASDIDGNLFKLSGMRISSMEDLIQIEGVLRRSATEEAVQAMVSFVVSGRTGQPIVLSQRITGSEHGGYEYFVIEFSE